MSCGCLLMFLIISATLSHIEAQFTLNFGEVTTVSCSTPVINYTLTSPEWPYNLTAATSFVIVLRRPGYGLVQFPFTASTTTTTWTVLPDTQLTDTGEIWIPAQPTGEVITVTVQCAFIGNTYTMEPVIPGAVLGSSGIGNFNTSSVIDNATTIHSHWWAVPTNQTDSTLYFFWAELCQPPSNPSLFNMRVVFPGRTATAKACADTNSGTYSLDGSANLRISSSVKNSISWTNVQSTVVYISVYTIDIASNLVATTFNVYQTNSNAPVQYYGAAFGLYTGHAIQVGDDLFLGGLSGFYYPEETDLMKLYFLDQSPSAPTTNLDPYFFVSACYLSTQAKSALYSSSLLNSSQDNQLRSSSPHIVKAENFFKDKVITDGIFTLTYNNYIALPSIDSLTRISENATTKEVRVIIIAFIGVSVCAVCSLITIVILAWRLKRQGAYNPIQ